MPRVCGMRTSGIQCINKLTSISIVPPILPSAALLSIAVATATLHSSALQSDKISGTLYYRSQLVDTLVDKKRSSCIIKGGFVKRALFDGGEGYECGYCR